MVDIILEGAVGIQEYKNSVKPGSHNQGPHKVQKPQIAQKGCPERYAAACKCGWSYI